MKLELAACFLDPSQRRKLKNLLGETHKTVQTGALRAIQELAWAEETRRLSLQEPISVDEELEEKHEDSDSESEDEFIVQLRDRQRARNAMAVDEEPEAHNPTEDARFAFFSAAEAEYAELHSKLRTDKVNLSLSDFWTTEVILSLGLCARRP